MGIIKYILYSRYRPLNLVETIFVSLLNLFYIKNSKLVTFYYTLQFIKPKFRQKICNKIYKSLNYGGGFVFFEKIRCSDARFQDILTQVYHEFKFNQGASKDEIYNKAISIRGVLEPFTREANVDLMKRAGFKDIISISNMGRLLVF